MKQQKSKAFLHFTVHGIENVSDAPLTYYVLKHRPKKRIDPSLSSKKALESGKTKGKKPHRRVKFGTTTNWKRD